MNIKLNFFGAARNVTGSCYCVEANGARVFVDCGFYQERDFKHRNWDPFPVPPSEVDAVLLTHAHLDHCGRLPKLVREGFKGRIFCTEATEDIAKIVLADSARIQVEDAKHKQRRHEREGREPPHPVVPLYTVEDADACSSLFSMVKYNGSVPVAKGMEAIFHDAGHILGSSSVELRVSQNGETRSILFSGDVGRWDSPIIRDPSILSEADYILVESTYGNRIHGPNDSIPGDLANIVNETRNAGGNIVIPSFAVERTQELLYRLSELLHENRIPHLMAFVDSPMAIRVTEVFRRHPELFDEEATDLIHSGKHPCDFPGLHMSRTVSESKAINQIRGTALIIAGSGMCTGGRVKHHLVNNITREESTILFVGYQAFGTLGRIILEGADEVRILGQKYPVRARIEKINGFSAHADRDELLKWLSGFKQPPRRLFVTHGEPEAADAFAGLVREKYGWNTAVAEYQEPVNLD